ncbi:checkpoint protein HUS1B [Peromyscus maniculatus bairdii]|uniref:Checkpoint protein n=1 Tax=Peromyscus maniculatus bairdii TaxID=230844 RepID=A0A6I9KWL0_PERMB|nr:checkpoint protein HUS1B [Peromyscus maniculatus bairdii]
MKFRARITSKSFLELFIQVSGTVARLTKVCVLRMCPDSLCFCPTGMLGEGQLWGEVRRGVFRHFCMEGVSEEFNEIYLELKSEHLARAVRNAGSASSLKLQLTNKRRPCLTVVVELASCPGHTRAMVHDLPVKVLPRRWWKEYTEPRVRASDVSVYLPALKTLKNMVERMANMGDRVLVEANLNGKMNLSVETDAVTIKSYFKNLGNPPKAVLGVTQGKDPENMVQVRVDNRKLLLFFEGQQINPTMALCNIVSNTLLHLVLVHDDISLQYFIPAS